MAYSLERCERRLKVTGVPGELPPHQRRLESLGQVDAVDVPGRIEYIPVKEQRRPVGGLFVQQNGQLRQECLSSEAIEPIDYIDVVGPRQRPQSDQWSSGVSFRCSN